MQFPKSISNMKRKIGWIGVGVMGNAMSQHLLKAGHELFVYSRTPSKKVNLVEQGAIGCSSIIEVAESADVIFTMVSFPSDVKKVYLEEKGLFQTNVKNKTFIDMTTNAPSLAMNLYEVGKELGASVLDAPVSGGDVGARNATLSIMVGGDEKVFEQVKDLFQLLGKNIVYQGKAGNGQHTKMSNQIALAGVMIGVCESLLYGDKMGLDLPTVLKSIAGGAAGSWTLDNLAPRILKSDFEPGFYVEHFIKDLRIALEEADRMNLALPGLALVKQLYTALIAQGKGKKGTQALILALKQLNNIAT